MSECPLIDKCVLNVESERFEKQCTGGRYTQCIIYFDVFIKPRKKPNEWKKERVTNAV